MIKRKKIFFNIFRINQHKLLQETHLPHKLYKNVRKSRQVNLIVTLAWKINHQVSKTKQTNTKDDEIKILILTFLFEKQIYQVLNICTPTNPSLRNKFFKNLQNHIKKHKTYLQQETSTWFKTYCQIGKKEILKFTYQVYSTYKK